jgi:hypothetical protein
VIDTDLFLHLIRHGPPSFERKGTHRFGDLRLGQRTQIGLFHQGAKRQCVTYPSAEPPQFRHRAYVVCCGAREIPSVPTTTDGKRTVTLQEIDMLWKTLKDLAGRGPGAKKCDEREKNKEKIRRFSRARDWHHSVGACAFLIPLILNFIQKGPSTLHQTQQCPSHERQVFRGEPDH